MKKILMLLSAIMFVFALGLGGVGSYIYFSARQDCAQMIVRAEDKTRTAATAQSEELKKDAEYARKGAVMICENSKERQTNALLFGAGALVSIITGVALLFFSRRANRRIE